MGKRRRKTKEKTFKPMPSHKACVSCRVMFWGKVIDQYCDSCLNPAMETSRIITAKRGRIKRQRAEAGKRRREIIAATEALDIQALAGARRAL